MTPTQTIKLTDVKVGDRMRKDLGSLDGLMDSIKRHGLIQPIVLDPSHNLIAGERRFRSCQQLGLVEVPFVYKEQLQQDVKDEIEFEENFWRKAMTWQEEALGILKIYRQKKMAAALEGWSQSYQKIISGMFGMSVGNINYILVVAKKLEDEQKLPEDKRKYWQYQSAWEAYRLGILDEEQQKINRELAERAKKAANTAVQQAQAHAIVKEVEAVKASPDALAEVRQRYESNPLNIVPFDQYWAEKEKLANEAKNTIYISNRFFQMDCFDFMLSDDYKGTIDHIVTDPPYGINLDYLNQSNTHGGMVDIDKLEDQHQVEANKLLLQKFFHAAFRVTKDHSFVICFCDLDNWELMKNAAVLAGFRVQRWAFIWRKVNQSVMNNCAGYNFTKDYEPALVCRKPSAVLAQKLNTCFKDASNVQVTKETGHPFAKPYEVTETLLNAISIPGQTILDPFAGGGSMLIQALRMKRNVFGCEIEEHWYNQMMTNLKNLYYTKINPNYVFK